MRITRLLNPTTWLVGQLICLQAASAQTVVEQVEAEPTGFSPSLSTSYVRSAADEESAYYQSVAAAEFGLTYKLANQSKISLSTGVTRNLDALEERNNWSSTSLSYSSKTLSLAEDLNFSYTGKVVAPTNSEMRDYLSYRGSLGLDLSVVRKWSNLPIGKSISLGLNSSSSRNFFEYDSTEAGKPNTIGALGTSLSSVFQVIDDLKFTVGYGLVKARKSNGTWVDTKYQHSVAASVNLNKQLSVSLTESNENRAYSYDAETLRFALYDYQTTVYKVAANYTF